MTSEKPLTTKHRLHVRNRHRAPYDLDVLKAKNEKLAPFVTLNKYDNESVDFFDPKAVYQLNRSLLLHHYNLEFWDLPSSFLCPPIPGRADYLHYLADLFGNHNSGRTSCEIPLGDKVNILDVGVGANCIYPLIGNHDYQWSFVGSESNDLALESAQKIIKANKGLSERIILRKQEDKKQILKGIIKDDEYFDAVMCNPPFYDSKKSANKASKNKYRKLTKGGNAKVGRNFSGTKDELWTAGGELKFISDMIVESKRFANSCFWFTSLVSKESHLRALYANLRDARAAKVKTIPMGQGQKKSRILAWSFLTNTQQKDWAAMRWNDQTKSNK